ELAEALAATGLATTIPALGANDTGGSNTGAPTRAGFAALDRAPKGSPAALPTHESFAPTAHRPALPPAAHDHQPRQTAPIVLALVAGVSLTAVAVGAVLELMKVEDSPPPPTTGTRPLPSPPSEAGQPAPLPQ